MFIDRRPELEMLEKCYGSDRAELFVLYGRRRVGKTELLAQFCSGKPHVFFVADLNAEPVLRAALSSAVNRALLPPEALSAVYPAWDDIFRLLASHAQEERLVVVLDEFTYLTEAHPPRASPLQRLWDSDLRRSNLMLILCGSYVGMMEREVLSYQAPLYGRRTGQHLLEPLSFHNAKPFFAHLDPVDQVRAYGIFGGTPAYLQELPAGDTLETLVADHVLTRGTYLYDEVRFLLQQELREPRQYFAIMEAIASGRTQQNEIKQATGIDSVSAYLSALQGLRLVERTVPATETRPHKSRLGLYRLPDHFFRFWFRFVHPNRTLLEQGGAEVALQNYVRPPLDQFIGPVFEQVCQQFLWRVGLRGDLPFMPERIGGWWRANAEIDVIALGKDEALLLECRWTGRPVGVDVLRSLESKKSLVQRDLGSRSVLYGLCARSGFTPAVLEQAQDRDDLLLFDLAAILAG
jgi:AAA+ ATPase superfamily predicted ATPase